MLRAALILASIHAQTPPPASDPPAEPSPPACADDASWHKKDDEAKNCQWVSQLLPTRCDVHGDDEQASNILRGHQVKMQRKWERQLKKRTCSMCGKTAPNSSRAFAYCGGCRHASIPRVDRPRYCSEACQRAHWAAGHMHECPRADAQQND